MDHSQDVEKKGVDEQGHACEHTKARRSGRACLVLVAISMALSVSMSLAALTVSLQEREDHHQDRHQQPDNIQANQANSDEPSPASGDVQAWSPQLKHAIRKRQAGAQGCNVTHWRQFCHMPAIRHLHHTVGARVTMSGNTMYRDAQGFLIWEYRPNDCVALCMGLDHATNQSMLISQQGVYNIRVELRSSDHFMPLLGIRMYVNGEQAAIKWFPNTPLANGDGNIEHMSLQVDSDSQPQGARKRHRQTPQAAGLSVLQQKSMEVPIVLERLMYLEAGSKVAVKAHGLVPRIGTQRGYVRDLILSHDDIYNNYLQVFRV